MIFFDTAIFRVNYIILRFFYYSNILQYQKLYAQRNFLAYIFQIQIFAIIKNFFLKNFFQKSLEEYMKFFFVLEYFLMIFFEFF